MKNRKSKIQPDPGYGPAGNEPKKVQIQAGLCAPSPFINSGKNEKKEKFAEKLLSINNNTLTN